MCDCRSACSNKSYEHPRFLRRDAVRISSEISFVWKGMARGLVAGSMVFLLGGAISGDLAWHGIFLNVCLLYVFWRCGLGRFFFLRSAWVCGPWLWTSGMVRKQRVCRLDRIPKIQVWYENSIVVLEIGIPPSPWLQRRVLTVCLPMALKGWRDRVHPTLRRLYELIIEAGGLPEVVNSGFIAKHWLRLPAHPFGRKRVGEPRAKASAANG